MRKRQGVFKTTWKKTLEELLEWTVVRNLSSFSEDHLEIKWKVSCKYYGKQTSRKIKYFEESKSNVNTI